MVFTKLCGCARRQLHATSCGGESVSLKVMGMTQLTPGEVLQNHASSWEQLGQGQVWCLMILICDTWEGWSPGQSPGYSRFSSGPRQGGKKASEFHCGRKGKAWHMLLLQGGCHMDTEKKPKGPSACFRTKEDHRHLSPTLFLNSVPLGVYFAHRVAFFQVLRLIDSTLQTFLLSLDSIFTAQNKPWGAYYTEIPGLWSKPTESQSPLVVPMLLS